jgi:hypothetical protein
LHPGLRAITAHQTTHFKILHSPLVSEQIFSRQLYPGSNPVAHSVGVGRARRAQKAPVYWMKLGLPFTTPRVYANCSEPLPCHRKYSTSDQQTVLVYLQVSIILWFTEPAGSLLCSPLTSILNSLHAYAFIINAQILTHSLKLPHRSDFLTFQKLEFWTQRYFREESLLSKYQPNNIILNMFFLQMPKQVTNKKDRSVKFQLLAIVAYFLTGNPTMELSKLNSGQYVL